MLDMGFIPDIERICKLLPPRRQTLFFSATMPPEIKRLVDTFLKDPVRIEVARPATVIGTITQRFRYCPSTDDWAKREMLRELIASEHVKNAIIFCNRKRDVAILLKSLLQARLQCRRAARRHGPDEPHGHARRLPRGQDHPAGGERRGGARPRHPRRQPHLQLRRALAVRRLRAPHRPHRPRRQGRPLADAGDARRCQAAQGHRAHAGRARHLDRRSAERRGPGRRQARTRSRPRRAQRHRRAASAIARDAVAAGPAAAPAAMERMPARNARVPRRDPMGTGTPSSRARCTPSRSRRASLGRLASAAPSGRPVRRGRGHSRSPASSDPANLLLQSRARARPGSGSPSASARTTTATMPRPPSASAITSRPS